MVVLAGLTDIDPLPDFVPLQPPLAVHDSSFRCVHFSVAELPLTIEVGLTEIVVAGMGDKNTWIEVLPPAGRWKAWLIL